MSGHYEHEFGVIDAAKLTLKGLNHESLLRLISLSIPRISESLYVCFSEGNDIDECESRLPLMDAAFRDVARVFEAIERPTGDIRFGFQPIADSPDLVEFIPPGVPLDDAVLRKRVIIPQAAIVPLRLTQLPDIHMTTASRVMFAGTFDHLHLGHRDVLTKALFMAKDKLYIAVTGDKLLAKKKCPDALQPFEERANFVKQFMESIRPNCLSRLEIEVVETPDGLYPADSIDLDVLIVTTETRSGGDLVNQARVKKGHSPLELKTIELVGGRSIEDKLSSTTIRSYMCASLPKKEEDLQWLHAEWNSLMLRLDVDKLKAEVWWSRLRDMYGLEPWRHYHNLRHVLELLFLAKAEYGEETPVEVGMAIWFHDAVYNPRLASNEENSIRLFDEFAKDAGISQLVHNNVSRGIDMTKTHLRNLASQDTSTPHWIPLFLEIDLAILGSESERYREYSNQVRAEYNHVAQDEFRRKRVQFLETYTDFAFQHIKEALTLTCRLRSNIKAEIARLS